MKNDRAYREYGIHHSHHKSRSEHRPHKRNIFFEAVFFKSDYLKALDYYCGTQQAGNTLSNYGCRRCPLADDRQVYSLQRRVFSVDITVDGDEEALLMRSSAPRVQKVEKYVYTLPENKRTSQLRPVVVGFGPAGMFASLMLARAGLKPLIVERGQKVDERTKSVYAFWNDRVLNTDSNIQFGEGGAGTFSDGELTTGIKDSRVREVFCEFCRNGAPEEIMISALPHIGTDKLKGVVKSLREKVISLVP